MPGRRRRPRGHIETLPPGSFRAKVFAELDPLTPKRRYVVETAKTYKAAEGALTRLQRQITVPDSTTRISPDETSKQGPRS